MEQQKIGKFIHDLRKEKEMTQKQLADMVGVSDKAISKWETGRGIPDTAIMSELCKVLGISINELLSGERLSVDNYSGKAEENMVNLLRDKEQEKQKWSKVKGALNLLWLLLFIFMIFILGMGQPDIRWFLDMPSLCLNIGFLILGLGITGQLKFFWMGIRAAYVRENFKDIKKYSDKVRLQKAEYALGFGIKMILLASAAVSIISCVTVLANLENLSVLGPNLAVMMLTFLYGIVFSMVILIFKARVHNRIME